MDIYLSEVEGGSKRFTFPSLPERIKVRNSTEYQTYDIISMGKIKIPKGMSPTDISWDGIFFGEAKKNESIVKHWEKPSECEKILQGWQENGTILRLMVTETNINVDVTIGSFTCEECGGFGNKEYSIDFARYKYLKIYTTDELKIVKFEKQIKARPAAPAAPANKGNYTVVSGDNLWSIARRFYGGSGSDWQKIYNANSDVIESTARRYGKSNSNNGWWIYPGTVFTIPN